MSKNNKQRASWYGDISTDISPSRYSKPGLLRVLKEIVPEGAEILDVGCGVGVDAAGLKSTIKGSGFGFDLSEKCVAKARKFGIESVVADWEKKWPFQREFDVVMASFVIHHLTNLSSFFHCCPVNFQNKAI